MRAMRFTQLSVVATMDNEDTRMPYVGNSPEQAVNVAAAWRMVEGVYRVEIEILDGNGNTRLLNAS